MWRNALWPLVHVGAILRVEGGVARRITLSGTEKLDGTFDFEGAILFGRRTEHVMSPDATVKKFDKNAPSWDGQPGGAGYPHFRWMRRLVGRFAKAPLGQAVPLRILDFGCGAGWVGIEAAKDVGEVEVSAFDPSPEMVRIAASNAEKEGGIRFDGRTGFGEDPPFGGEHGPAFPLVISSGVVSFSPDVERWLDGLASTVEPGGTLIVGDIHPGLERLPPASSTQAPSAGPGDECPQPRIHPGGARAAWIRPPARRLPAHPARAGGDVRERAFPQGSPDASTPLGEPPRDLAGRSFSAPPSRTASTPGSCTERRAD